MHTRSSFVSSKIDFRRNAERNNWLSEDEISTNRVSDKDKNDPVDLPLESGGTMYYKAPFACLAPKAILVENVYNK